MRTYSGLICKLEPNQIFVFGSNPEGRHGKGSALWARKNAGAIYGKGRGLQGQSYAIVTKDLSKKTHPSVSPENIILQIQQLYEYARLDNTLDFVIAYSITSVNLNGYSNQEMAQMFSDAGIIPCNIIFEEGFSKLVYGRT